MEKITVLLADASAEYRMALREKMEESGDFRIVGEAEDGQHTLQMVREMKPQVLVLDGMLPVLDGMAVLRAVQEQPKKPVFLVLEQPHPRRGQKVQQVHRHGVRRRNAQHQRHNEQQQRAAAHAPAGQDARTAAHQQRDDPARHSRYRTPP